MSIHTAPCTSDDCPCFQRGVGVIKVSVIIEPGRQSFQTTLPAVPRKGDYLQYNYNKRDWYAKIRKVVWCTWTPDRVTVYL